MDGGVRWGSMESTEVFEDVRDGVLEYLSLMGRDGWESSIGDSESIVVCESVVWTASIVVDGCRPSVEGGRDDGRRRAVEARIRSNNVWEK